MRYLIALLIALLPTTVWASSPVQSMMGMWSAGAGEPAAEVTIATNLVTPNGTAIALVSNIAKGTSFTAANTGALKTVRLYVASYSAGAEVVCRVGSAADMASTYIEQATSPTITNTGYLDITFAGTNTLTAGTTYYLGCIYQDAAVSIARDDSKAYAGGLFYYASSGFTLTNTVDIDIVFRVMGE